MEDDLSPFEHVPRQSDMVLDALRSAEFLHSSCARANHPRDLSVLTDAGFGE
jgi:hypothetical protein